MLLESPSSRRAWIEIHRRRGRGVIHGSPSSRRAWIEIENRCHDPARNPVALLAEGVDRNKITPRVCGKTYVSPSSRRAWIEIRYTPPRFPRRGVALLAEGVDRNLSR